MKSKIEFYRVKGDVIIFTRNTHQPDYLEGEGEILCHFNSLSFKVFKTVGRKGQKDLLLFYCKEIILGICVSVG